MSFNHLDAEKATDRHAAGDPTKDAASVLIEESNIELDEVDADVLAQMDLAFPNAPKNAKMLSIKELARELELRGHNPTGFFAPDSDTLQELYHLEHKDELAVAQRRRTEWLLQKKKTLEEAQQQKKILLERREEIRALVAHPHAAFWVKMIAQNGRGNNGGLNAQCPPDAQISNVNPPLLRALCRPLASNTRLVNLSLSQSTFAVASGTLLSIALCRNTGIRRLELDDCKIGPEMIGEFGKVLEENGSLQHISFEDNPLTGKNEENIDGVQRLFLGLQKNSSLLMLNMWRTGLGTRGGALLIKNLRLNQTLLSLGVGCNWLNTPAEREIAALLGRNAAIKSTADKNARAEKERHDKEQYIIRKREDTERKRIEEEEWLQQRKMERAEARTAAKLAEEQRIAEEAQLENEARLAEKEAAKLKAEAKNKKKKGKKK